MTPAAFVFDDAEPEDAWQADDPLPVLIDNLERRVGLIGVMDRFRIDLLRRHFMFVLDRMRTDHG